MGCDIHCYIEYKRPEPEGWSPFGGRLNPGRHYGVFAKLAGVRNHPEWGIVPIAEPRGLPEGLAYEADGDSKLFVLDRDEVESEGCVSTANAERWVAQGSSKFIDGHNGPKTAVTHPDWHSHSWVTLDELVAALGDPKVGLTADSWSRPGYKALVGAMHALRDEGCEVRLVFWFDN